MVVLEGSGGERGEEGWVQLYLGLKKGWDYQRGFKSSPATTLLFQWLRRLNCYVFADPY